ncbi:MAG: hypothetical protein ACJ797_05025 [Ktedonobacteraceae bacterium]
MLILSVSHEGNPLTGLVTLRSRLGAQTPLANGGKACSAGRSGPHPEGPVNDQRQSGELRWHSLVP